MGKKPINKKQVQTIRKIISGNPLHELLLNLSVYLMLRSSDLLSLKVSDVISQSGEVRSEVKVKQKKTGKTTLNIPLSQLSQDTIKDHLSGRDLSDYIFTGNKSNYTRKPITTHQYARIVKDWMSKIGIDDVSHYSTHSMRKTKASLIYSQTHDVESVRRLLGQSSVTATSAYLGVSDESALKLAKKFTL